MYVEMNGYLKSIVLLLLLTITSSTLYSTNPNRFHEMVKIPAGTFKRGNNQGHFNEKPRHKVYLNTFYIDKHEVTNAQFQTFIKKSDYQPQGPWKRGYKKGQEKHPVRFVTWHDATAYAEWASKKLPTESQWEKAAAGPKNTVYPWGNTWKQIRNDENYHPVMTIPADKSGYGCHDMAGNVWEWCRDWFDRYAYEQYRESPKKDPTGPTDNAQPENRFVKTNTAPGNERSTLKVIRSGRIIGKFGKENARVSKRVWGNPHYWFNDTGFRCVIEKKEESL
jgi:formylglycine-generating enzyme required for sulfatase activity